jgi:hypothetical protein
MSEQSRRMSRRILNVASAVKQRNFNTSYIICTNYRRNPPAYLWGEWGALSCAWTCYSMAQGGKSVADAMS